MNVGTLEADVIVNLDSLDKGIASANANIGKLQSQFEKSAMSVDKQAAAVDRWAQKLNSAEMSIANLEAKQEQWKSKMETQNTIFDQQVAALEQLDQQLAKSSSAKQITALSKEHAKLADSNAKTADKLNQATSEYEKYTAQLELARDRVQQLKTAQDAVMESTSEISDEFSDAAKKMIDGIEGSTSGMDELGKSVLTVGKDTDKFGGILGELGDDLFRGITRGAGSAASSIKLFGSSTAEAKAASAGMSAVLRALASSSGYIAVGAAAAYGAFQLYDWASGAKAARKATEEMIETAEKWKSTQAKTIYDTGEDPFVRFAVDRSSFSRTIGQSEDFVTELIKVWSDGKKETDDIVKQFVDGFTQGSDKVREVIEGQEKTLSGLGVEPTQAFKDKVEADKKQLDEWDKEISDLLEKKQNKMLTEQEQLRLEEISKQRVELEVEYTQPDKSSFDAIMTDIEAEINRLKLLGKEAGTDLYGDALKGAALGHSEAINSLNQSYDEQYAAIKKIVGEEERDAALSELNAQYKKDEAEAVQQYADALGKIITPALETEEAKAGEAQIEQLNDFVDRYNAAKTEIERNQITSEMGEAFTDMDEGAIASYLALLAQIQDLSSQGVDISEMFPDTEDALKNFNYIKEFLEDTDSTSLDGLKKAFTEAIPQEVQRVGIELDIDTDGKWASFSTEVSKGLKTSVTIDPVEDITVNAIAPVQLENVPETLTINSVAPVTLTGLPEGPITIPANVPATVEGLPDTVTIQGTAPVTLTGVPETLNIPAEAIISKTTNAADLFDGLQPDGTYKIPVTVEYNPKELGAVGGELDFKPGAFGIGASTIEQIKSVTKDAEALKKATDDGTQSLVSLEDILSKLELVESSGGFADATTLINQFNAAIAAGEEVPPEQIEQMKTLISLLEALEAIDISETSLSKPMSELGDSLGADWDKNLEPIITALKGMVEKAQTAGTDIGTGLTDSTAAAVEDGTSTVTDAVETMSSDAEDAAEIDGKKPGSDFTSELAASIRAGKSDVVNAVKEVAAAAQAAANITPRYGGGATSGSDGSGRTSSKGLNSYIAEQTKLVEDVIAKFASSTASLLTDSKLFDFPEPGAIRAARTSGGANGQPVVIDIDYDQLAMAMSQQQISLNLDGRRVADGLANDNARAQTVRTRAIVSGYGG